MLSSERCYEIDEYIYKLLYHKKETIEEELVLVNKEEQDYFDRSYLAKEKRKIARDEYQKKHKKEK